MLCFSHVGLQTESFHPSVYVRLFLCRYMCYVISILRLVFLHNVFDYYHLYTIIIVITFFVLSKILLWHSTFHICHKCIHTNTEVSSLRDFTPVWAIESEIERTHENMIFNKNIYRSCSMLSFAVVVIVIVYSISMLVCIILSSSPKNIKIKHTHTHTNLQCCAAKIQN